MTKGAAVITRTMVERVLGREHGFGSVGWEAERGRPEDEAARPAGTTRRGVAIIVQFGWTTSQTSDRWYVAVEPIGAVISRPFGVERLVRPGSDPQRFPVPDLTAAAPAGAGDPVAVDAIVSRCVAATRDGLVLRSFHAVLDAESGRLSEAAVTGPAWEVRILRGSDLPTHML